MLYQEENRVIFKYDSEVLWVEPWGPNAFRVRASKSSNLPSEIQGLMPVPPTSHTAETHSTPEGIVITHGKIKATISNRGKLTLTNSQSNAIILEEYSRNRLDLLDEKCSALEIQAREFKPIVGGDYHVTARFESQDPNEKIFGMGQYQHPYLDLKGLDIELAHRNSQATVPFALSSRGYGFLWNNPAIGRAVFGKNIMSFEAYATTAIDYWVYAGDRPAEIVEAYMAVTGKPPMMPEYGLGFWQCKLRYESQEELLRVAREYHQRQLPIDLIVVDFFHWPMQGEWKFDPKYWPDPSMCSRSSHRITNLACGDLT